MGKHREITVKHSWRTYGIRQFDSDRLQCSGLYSGAFERTRFQVCILLLRPKEKARVGTSNGIVNRFCKASVTTRLH